MNPKTSPSVANQVSNCVRVFESKHRLRVYNKNRRLMNTGDVIAFQGNDPGAKIIRKSTKSEYSHVGLVMSIPELNRKFIIEAVPVGGVVLMPLSFKLKTYTGKAWWLPISADPAKRLQIYKTMMSSLGRPYDLDGIGNIVQKIFAPFAYKPKLEDFSRFICSELVGLALKSIGLIDELMNVSESTPEDIVSLDVYRQKVPLVG